MPISTTPGHDVADRQGGHRLEGFVVAAAAGVVHAASSLYWAAGGTWLLDTVGQWAIDELEARPGFARTVLAGIGLAKLVAAAVPWAVERGRLPGRRVWRPLSWIGAVGLILYGGVNTVVALAVLGGIVTPDGGYERAAMIGHAFLWDPLFLLWGTALATGLWRTRDG